MPKPKYEFVIDCVNANGRDIAEMVDRAREITYQTFTRWVNWRDAERLFGGVYGPGDLRLRDDYHVSYYRSRYRGRPCVYIKQSGIEYVFCPPKEVKMALELKVEASGKTTSDLVEALREVIRWVEQGFTSGADRNESGSYHFTRTGEEDEEE